MANESEILEFVLIGFPGLPEKFHIVFGILIFLLYNVSLCVNSTVITLVVLKQHLHQPMYIIIASLAMSDVLFDISTLPKIIAKYWLGAGSMSLYGCFIQMFIIHTLNSLDSLILLLMAVDRYVAICKPLRYHSIMRNGLVALLCLMLWLTAAVIGICLIYITYQLPYLGSNKVKNFFCSMGTVSVTSRADPTSTLLKGYYIGLAFHLGPLSFIIFSYSIIITKICTTARSESWHKAFYTCVTHWFVIGTYFIPRMIVYTFDTTQKPQIDVYIFLICIYSFVPHCTSPIIFCLRTEEIKRTLGTVFKRKNTP
ncbi:olfactory receptor 2AT4-like [Pseudophryne corroboree]|uniref:olfactory receptor 2AT4-like n=1 Tax=Pseudophryne corroboree TaxID=495146 RepID=UPI003081DFCE